jgi:hypothetical protein
MWKGNRNSRRKCGVDILGLWPLTVTTASSGTTALRWKIAARFHKAFCLVPRFLDDHPAQYAQIFSSDHCASLWSRGSSVPWRNRERQEDGEWLMKLSKLATSRR